MASEEDVQPHEKEELAAAAAPPPPDFIDRVHDIGKTSEDEAENTSSIMNEGQRHEEEEEGELRRDFVDHVGVVAKKSSDNESVEKKEDIKIQSSHSEYNLREESKLVSGVMNQHIVGDLKGGPFFSSSLEMGGVETLRYERTHTAKETEEVIEVEFERAMLKFHTHTPYCPNCMSQITRVVLRRRKVIVHRHWLLIALCQYWLRFTLFILSGNSWNVNFGFAGWREYCLNRFSFSWWGTYGWNFSSFFSFWKSTVSAVTPHKKTRRKEKRDKPSVKPESQPGPLPSSSNISKPKPETPDQEAKESKTNKEKGKEHSREEHKREDKSESDLDDDELEREDEPQDDNEPGVLPKPSPRKKPKPTDEKDKISREKTKKGKRYGRHKHTTEDESESDASKESDYSDGDVDTSPAIFFGFNRNKLVEILKCIVYGGLIESITSLSVVFSVSASDTTTLNVLAIGIAVLFSGLIAFTYNIVDFKNDAYSKKKYRELLGSKKRFLFHATIAMLSYLVFGLVSPITYSFAFRESDNKKAKIVVVALAAFACIVILAIAKAFVTGADSLSSYVKKTRVYIFMAVNLAGAGYVVGWLIEIIMIKLEWFKSSQRICYPPEKVAVIDWK